MPLESSLTTTPQRPAAATSRDQIHLLLADDHKIFRQGLRILVQQEGFPVVAEAADGIEAVQLAQAYRPEVAILDLKMPVMDGIEAAREIHKCSPRTQTILLTMYEEEAYAVEALCAGMRGYVLKSQTSTDLVNTILEVAKGAIHLSRGISQGAVNAYATRAHLATDPLSERERQVLQMIAEGNSTRNIAATLGLSVKTVESHRSRIMQKLDIHRTAELIRYSVRHRLVPP